MSMRLCPHPHATSAPRMLMHTMTPEALHHNKTLQEIYLGGNEIKDAGAAALAEASEQMPMIYISE